MTGRLHRRIVGCSVQRDPAEPRPSAQALVTAAATLLIITGSISLALPARITLIKNSNTRAEQSRLRERESDEWSFISVIFASPSAAGAATLLMASGVESCFLFCFCLSSSPLSLAPLSLALRPSPSPSSRLRLPLSCCALSFIPAARSSTFFLFSATRACIPVARSTLRETELRFPSYPRPPSPSSVCPCVVGELCVTSAVARKRGERGCRKMGRERESRCLSRLARDEESQLNCILFEIRRSRGGEENGLFLPRSLEEF